MTAGAGILHDELPTEQAFTHGGPVRPAFDIEVLDLRDWPLPIFAEHQGTISEAFDEADLPINPVTDISLGVALDDLAWWSAALERAEAAGELAPAAFRIEAAAAAVDEIEDEVV